MTTIVSNSILYNAQYASLVEISLCNDERCPAYRVETIRLTYGSYNLSFCHDDSVSRKNGEFLFSVTGESDFHVRLIVQCEELDVEDLIYNSLLSQRSVCIKSGIVAK